ncbi:MAG TPA: lytic murein transglycosylase [Solirubrobacteraceae bacterium]|nr:lytic murein transglycosylase [Solirubrobacteraceae bacterium]
MNRRKLVTALVAAGVFSAGFGVAVLPAAAEQRTFVVTLLGGRTITVQLDVPPGTPLDQIKVPGVSTPIVGISEVPPQPTATPEPTATAAPAEDPARAGNGSDPSDPKVQEGGQKSQKTQSRRASDPAKGDTADLISIVEQEKRGKQRSEAGRGRNVDGTPTLDNPTFSLAVPGAAPIGVPNFFIDKFRIPPFLLSIYQAAGIEYGVRWEILAAINEIETDYGRNLNVSSAGALGWMQFMPATWRQYGVDANRDGVKDPYNPVDAIFAAARYLRAAGAETDLRKAIFAYNHADWYVDSVLMRARVLGGLPSNFVGSLTGLTQGHFPVHARATYADDLSEEQLARRKRKGNPAWLVQADEHRRGINVYSRAGAPVIAVNDGRIVRIGRTPRLGRFVQLQDVYGNTYTYGHLKKVSKLYPAPKRREVSRREIARELDLPQRDPAPAAPASDPAKAPALSAAARLRSTAEAVTQTPAASKERLFANPFRPRATTAGGAQQVLEGKAPREGFEVFRSTFSRVFGVKTRSKDITLKRLQPGARVVAGTILGRIGRTRAGVAPHLLFEIRPAGRGAPRIDPKPILDGWKLLESTAIYRAAGKNPFFGADAKQPSIGQILMMSKEALERQVLADPRIEMYDCGRRDVRLGAIDRRVLATLKFLSASGLKPTVTSLQCGHSYYTASGNVSHHSSGNAVDIAKVNGIPILGHQGEGSITEMTIQRLLTLQGLMKPDQIISLMTFKDADNTYAMGDHADHIHIGFRPMYGTNTKAAKQVNAILKPDQWIKLIDRLHEIDNPTVLQKPSKYAIKTVKRASKAHRGE